MTCHGWRFPAVALCAFLSTGLTIGTTQYSFGVFVEPLEEEFGWSRASINGATSLGLVTYALFSPAMGRFCDKHGVHTSTTLCLGLLCLGWLCLATTNSLPQFYLAYFIMYVGYTGTTMLSSAKIIGSWFSERRGRMMGIVTAGNNTCGLAMVNLATFVEGKHDWRSAGLVFSLVLAIVTLLFFLVVQNQPVVSDVKNPDNEVHLQHPVALEEVGVALYHFAPPHHKDPTHPDHPYDASGQPVAPVAPTRANVNPLAVFSAPVVEEGGEAVVEKEKEEEEEEAKEEHPPMEQPQDVAKLLKTRAFFTVTWAVVCTFWTYGAVLIQLLNHLEAEGMSSSEAATGISITAILGICSKVGFGRLSEQISARWALVICNSIQILALLIFIVGGDSKAALYAGCVVYGSGFGGVGALMPLTVMEIFGLVSFASIFGSVCLLFVIPGVIGPLLAGLSYDMTDHYLMSFGVTICVFLSSIVMLVLSPAKYRA